jgi:hypothetical protein
MCKLEHVDVLFVEIGQHFAAAPGDEIIESDVRGVST